MGLSPRVRGNPIFQCLELVRDVSIPACAGEPVHSSAITPDDRVYPRVCGGTSRCPPESNTGTCLSPRVRENLAELSGTIDGAGSIPACAGEPQHLHLLCAAA